jgi:phosphoserine phosphatase
LNQTDLIQKIIATEHQAQALTEQAKKQQENMEASITSEIEDLRRKYQEEAEAYLQKLMQSEHEKSAKDLQALDDRLTVKLQQVESVYAAQKDQWVQAIFERIVGKAGG